MEKDLDTTTLETPACLDSNTDQTLRWQRLGSPITSFENNQFAPALLSYEEQLWLYFSVRESLRDTVYLITTQDGESWSEPIPIHDFDNFSELKHLNIRTRENTFFAMIGGGRIGSATSDDGINWSITGTQIIPTADFDMYGQLYPAQNNNGDQLWYSGFDGTTFAIGRATLSNDQWIPQGPIIEPVVNERYRNTAVAQSSIYESDDSIMMWYGGYDTSQTDPGPWRIMTAHSVDGEIWSTHALALDISPSGEEAWSVREPSVAMWNGKLWMAYIAMGDDGAYRLRLANCGN